MDRFSWLMGCVPSVGKFDQSPLKRARIGALATFLVLLLASTALGQEVIVSARIVGITDGDTVKALVAGNELLRVRLSWIDAPEKSQAFGQRSKQHLSELVFGREVELHTHGLDRYGRTLAVIFVDGIDANLEQVRSGMAWVYTRYLSRPPPISRRATGKLRPKPGSSNADSGVSGIRFRRGNIGALPGKQSNLPAIRGLKGKARTMLEGSRHTKARLWLGTAILLCPW